MENKFGFVLAWLSLWVLAYYSASASPVLVPKNERLLIQPVEAPDTRDLCFLPPEVDKNAGLFTLLEDCDSMDLFRTVPPSAYRRRGASIHVCCPQKPPESAIIFPDEYEYEGDYEDYGDYGEFVDVQQQSQEPPVRFQVHQGCQCTDLDACNQNNLNGDSPPVTCGWNPRKKAHMFCCEGNSRNTDRRASTSSIRRQGGLSGVNVSPRNAKRYQCEDQSKECKFWAKNFPESCTDFQHPSFDFMTFACMKSCGICAREGCVDKFSKCEDWARDAKCISHYDTMGIYCRQSCGTCGFYSPRNREDQNVDGKSSTFLNDRDFFCGRVKSKEGDKKDKPAGPRVKQPVNSRVRTGGFEDLVTGLRDTLPYSAGKRFLSKRSPQQFRRRQETVPFDEDGLFYYGNENLEGDREIQCGQVIIADRFILAAAHCQSQFVKDNLAEDNRVQAVLIRDGQEGMERIEYRRVFSHPNFVYGEHYNDIALIELGRRIRYDYEEFGDSPACIGSGGNNGRGDDLAGRKATAEGWGYTENNTVSDVLLTVDLNIIDNADCAEYLRTNTSENLNRKTEVAQALYRGINDQLVCTTGIYNKTLDVYSGPCRGDSGGPLYVSYGPEGDAVKTVEGLVVGGVSCGKNIPAYYTRVSAYRKWFECLMDALNTGASKRQAEERCFSQRGAYGERNPIF